MTDDGYVIRSGLEGRERLRLLSAVLGPSTSALLAQVGIPAGAACFDLGCGGGDVSRELARLVGPSGRVLGIDRDETTIAIARGEAEQEGLANVIFEVRDAVEWEPAESFDFVYARFLLTHLADPGALARRLRRRVRPGGAVVLEDIDFRGHFTEPDCPALRRYVALYSESVRRRGADPNIGPRLPGLLREAGFSDVHMNLYQPAALVGDIKLLTCATLENIADAVLRDGLIGEEDLRRTTEELLVFARDPYTVLGGPRIFQVWGRNAVPAGGAG